MTYTPTKDEINAIETDLRALTGARPHPNVGPYIATHYEPRIDEHAALIEKLTREKDAISAELAEILAVAEGRVFPVLSASNPDTLRQVIKLAQVRNALQGELGDARVIAQREIAIADELRTALAELKVERSDFAGLGDDGPSDPKRVAPIRPTKFFDAILANAAGELERLRTNLYRVDNERLHQKIALNENAKGLERLTKLKRRLILKADEMRKQRDIAETERDALRTRNELLVDELTELRNATRWRVQLLEAIVFCDEVPPFYIIVDPALPAGEAHFVNARGVVIGKIVDIGAADDGGAP